MALFGFSPNPARTVTVATRGVAAVSGAFQGIAATTGELDFWFDLTAVVAAAFSQVASVNIVVTSAIEAQPEQLYSGTDGTKVCVVLEDFAPGDFLTFALAYTLANGATGTFTAGLRVYGVAAPIGNAPVNLSTEEAVSADNIVDPLGTDSVLMIRNGQVLSISLTTLIAELGTGATVNGVTFGENDIVFSFTNGQTYTAAGAMAGLESGISARIAARQDARPSTAGTIWPSGPVLELSQGT